MADENALQERLEEMLKTQSNGISVMYTKQGEYISSQRNAVDIDTPVQIGCIAKTLTSILAAFAQMEGVLKLEDRLADHFPVTGKFHDLALGHLLNQTSGIDQSMVESLPRTAGGFINRQELLAQLESCAVLSRPGSMFHYGNLGPWLVAAMLEKIYGLSYAELLETLIFTPLEIRLPAGTDTTTICPSIGLGLKLSARDLIKILSLHVQGSPERPELVAHLEKLRSVFGFELAGSAMMAVKAYPGWFDYGNSFGQLGHGTNSAAVIRLLPDQEMAIAITADQTHLAHVALAVLFKDSLVEFSGTPPISLINAADWAKINPHVYAGSYENGRYRLLVDIATNGSLRARVYQKADEVPGGNGEPSIKRYFKAALGDSFIPTEPEPQVCPVLHFSGPDGDRAGFQYISTGSYVFTRSDQWRQLHGA